MYIDSHCTAIKERVNLFNVRGYGMTVHGSRRTIDTLPDALAREATRTRR